jgi:hypothetical protein
LTFNNKCDNLEQELYLLFQSKKCEGNTFAKREAEMENYVMPVAQFLPVRREKTEWGIVLGMIAFGALIALIAIYEICEVPLAYQVWCGDHYQLVCIEYKGEIVRPGNPKFEILNRGYCRTTDMKAPTD